MRSGETGFLFGRSPAHITDRAVGVLLDGALGKAPVDAGVSCQGGAPAPSAQGDGLQGRFHVAQGWNRSIQPASDVVEKQDYSAVRDVVDVAAVKVICQGLPHATGRRT